MTNTVYSSRLFLLISEQQKQVIVTKLYLTSSIALNEAFTCPQTIVSTHSPRRLENVNLTKKSCFF